jgi:hypothetical protein
VIARRGEHATLADGIERRELALVQAEEGRGRDRFERRS